MGDVDLERQKLEAEIGKIAAETDLLRRQGWTKAADFMKVAGAIVATIAGLYAVITTYRITQLETRLAVREREQADKDREAAIAARKHVHAELAQANLAKANVERELATLVAQVELARRDIENLTVPRRPIDFGSLVTVSGNLESASEKAARSLPFVFIVPARPGQGDVVTKLAFRITHSGASTGTSAPLRNIRNAPPVTELHYFKHADRAEAERLVTRLKEAGVPSARALYAHRPDIARYRYYELRLPIRLTVP